MKTRVTMKKVPKKRVAAKRGTKNKKLSRGTALKLVLRKTRRKLRSAAKRKFRILGQRLRRIRNRPRQRMIPWMVWTYLRLRWPYKKRAWELVELADGTIKRNKTPLRPWFPWSLILRSDRVLFGPLICATGLAAVRALGLRPVAIIALSILVLFRIWWVCQKHKSKVLLWSVRTSYAAMLTLAVVTTWLILNGPYSYLLYGFAVVVAVRFWHYTKGWDKDRLTIKKTWDVSLGMKGKKLPGSTLTNVTYYDDICELSVQLPRGSLTTVDVERAVDSIASAYGTRPTCVQVVRTADDGCPRVKLLPDKVLSVVHPWPGKPVGADGQLVAGVMRDGKPAIVPLWTEHGAKMMILVGARGSGKSRAVHLLISASLRSGLVALDILDAKGGIDLNRWKEYSYFFGIDVIAGRKAVNRANRIHDARLKYLVDKNKEKFVIGEDGPLWLLVMEESIELLADKEIADGLARISRLSRATGVGVVLVSQVAKVDSIGGREVIGNVDVRIVFSCDRITAQTITDGRIPIIMSQMPVDLPGAALFLTQNSELNTAVFGRWYDVDLDTVTTGAARTPLDRAAAEAVAVDQGETETLVPQRVPPSELPGSGKVSGQLKMTGHPDDPEPSTRAASVRRYAAEHPDASSEQIAKVFGVSARTVRYWRTHPALNGNGKTQHD